ncbi:MAG: DUF4363 family protein [Clostridia bacterium]|nr:DUF4363 family protein [Clostridia bacterium]
MKTAIIALMLLISVLALVIANSIILNNIIEKLTVGVEALETENPSVTHSQLIKLYGEFKSRRGYIGLTVNHNDITSIEASFSELFGAAEAGDTETVTIVKSRLVSELTHLGRLSGINFDSIF